VLLPPPPRRRCLPAAAAAAAASAAMLWRPRALRPQIPIPHYDELAAAPAWELDPQPSSCPPDPSEEADAWEVPEGAWAAPEEAWAAPEEAWEAPEEAWAAPEAAWEAPRPAAEPQLPTTSHPAQQPRRGAPLALPPMPLPRQAASAAAALQAQRARRRSQPQPSRAQPPATEGAAAAPGAAPRAAAGQLTQEQEAALCLAVQRLSHLAALQPPASTGPAQRTQHSSRAPSPIRRVWPACSVPNQLACRPARPLFSPRTSAVHPSPHPAPTSPALTPACAHAIPVPCPPCRRRQRPAGMESRHPRPLPPLQAQATPSWHGVTPPPSPAPPCRRRRRPAGMESRHPRPLPPLQAQATSSWHGRARRA
jgi:hypothetical protein